jgi:hypothetical protein
MDSNNLDNLGNNYSDILRLLLENLRMREAFNTIVSRDLTLLYDAMWGDQDSETKEALNVLLVKWRTVYKVPILILSMYESDNSLSALSFNLSSMLFTRLQILGNDKFSADRASNVFDEELLVLEKYLNTIYELGKANPGRFVDVFSDQK